MLDTYRVNYKEYKNINEPMIYIWEEKGTERIIARVFNTGLTAENSRRYYANKTNQEISWCKGVFPIDMDKDFIKNWYPTVEFQDELIEKGRKGRGKDKQPRKRRTRAEIEQELHDKDYVSMSVQSINKNTVRQLKVFSAFYDCKQEEIVIKAIEEFIDNHKKEIFL